jgi:DNA (cytosine-5)-methyltransferase 1
MFCVLASHANLLAKQDTKEVLMIRINLKEVIYFSILWKYWKQKKPKVFFLENVRGIVNHDNGNTFKVIRNIIENELGYSFHYQIVRASDYGLPQLRPRAFMIGFKNESILSSFSFPPP